MAPAAAHLANGVDLLALGDEVDPVSLAPGIIPLPEVEDATIRGEVLWVDRFGNCQLNVDPELLLASSARRRATTSRCVLATRAGGPAGCTPLPTPRRQSSC